MRRLAAAVVLVAIASSCVDDHVRLVRGPLGPASYDVEVRASGERRGRTEDRRARLRIEPEVGGTAFTLRTSGFDAQFRRLDDGSIVLERVRGAPVRRTGETDLASLVSQLNPPLPAQRVRLGERWSSTQRIRTPSLGATLRTQLRIVRYRRIASTDTAELEGTVTGRLRTTEPTGVLDGALRGRARIAWAVKAGRVVAADTTLVWTIRGGDRVTLETVVRPR